MVKLGVRHVPGKYRIKRRLFFTLTIPFMLSHTAAFVGSSASAYFSARGHAPVEYLSGIESQGKKTTIS